MGLYNAVFGYNEHASAVLDILRLKAADFVRFRDGFVANGELVVYTRLGGGNRAAYAATIERLRKHALYLRDADDNFDSTYATFYFRIPEEHRALTSEWDIGPFDAGKRWKEALRKLKDDPSEAERVMDRLPGFVGFLKAGLKGD